MISEWIKRLFGLQPTPEETAFSKRVQQSHKTLTVSERGSVMIDPTEVRSDPTFKEYLKQGRGLVNHNQKESQ